jgi:hypothetical protein
MLKVIIFLDDAVKWQREFRKRWPAAVGIMRGKTVVYAAHIQGQLTIENRNGAVLMDSSFENPGGQAMVMRSR